MSQCCVNTCVAGKKKCDDDSETSNWIHVNTKVYTHSLKLNIIPSSSSSSSSSGVSEVSGHHREEWRL